MAAVLVKRTIEIFDTRHEYDILKHFASCKHFVIFHPKKANNPQFYRKMA